MAKDLGTRILSFLQEQARTSTDGARPADLAAHFKVSESDIQDELLLLNIEGLVQEVSGYRKGESSYKITETGVVYLTRV